MKPVASDPSEKPKLSSAQPQPPSSPAHSDSRRSGGSKAERGVKRCLKNKAPSDKAATDSVGVKAGAADASGSTSKPAAGPKGQQQQPQEPSAKRSIVRPPKTAKEAASPASRDPVRPANSKAPPAGRSPQPQRRDGDNRAERPEQKPGPAAASLTNKTQVGPIRLQILHR